MIKFEEAATSCLNRAGDQEMIFVLLGRDAAAPTAIRRWAEERIRLGKNAATDEQILEALHCADFMDQQRKDGIGLPIPVHSHEERRSS